MRSWYGLEDYETDLDTQSLKFLSFKLLLVGSFRLFLWRGTHFACSDLWVMGMEKFHQGNVESERGQGLALVSQWYGMRGQGRSQQAMLIRKVQRYPIHSHSRSLYIPLPWWWLCNNENMNSFAYCLNSSVAPHCSLAEASHYRCWTYF